MSEGDRRVLDAPMVSFALDEEVTTLTQSRQWQTGTRAAITLVKNAAAHHRPGRAPQRRSPARASRRGTHHRLRGRGRDSISRLGR